MVEGFGGGFPSFNRSESSFQALSELMTRLTGDAFHKFFDATIRSDRETNCALRHPMRVLRCKW